MSVPAAGSWLDILLRQTAGSRSSARPLQASLNLSTTLPQTTPPTENLQSEISSVVVADGQRFTLSSGGGGTLQITSANGLPATPPALLERLSYGPAPATVSPAQASWTSQSVATFGSLVAVALSPSDYGSQGGQGVVRFYRATADGGLTFLQDVSVGFLPDGLAFNSAGTTLVVANEGEPTSPLGSVDSPRSSWISPIAMTRPARVR